MYSLDGCIGGRPLESCSLAFAKANAHVKFDSQDAQVALETLNHASLYLQADAVNVLLGGTSGCARRRMAQLV